MFNWALTMFCVGFTRGFHSHWASPPHGWEKLTPDQQAGNNSHGRPSIKGLLTRENNTPQPTAPLATGPGKQQALLCKAVSDSDHWSTKVAQALGLGVASQSVVSQSVARPSLGR